MILFAAVGKCKPMGGGCQLELILARLNVSDKQETTVYSAFQSERSRVLAEISLKLTKPERKLNTLT